METDNNYEEYNGATIPISLAGGKNLASVTPTTEIIDINSNYNNTYKR